MTSIKSTQAPGFEPALLLFLATIVKRQVHKNKNVPPEMISAHCKEVRFASFLSGRFTTMAVINCTCVHCRISIKDFENTPAPKVQQSSINKQGKDICQNQQPIHHWISR